MARRFGGKFSPDGNTQPPSPVRSAPDSDWRANLLFFVPLPLVFRAFFSDPVGLGLNLMAFAALIAAAWLTREGLKARTAYEQRKVARHPALPRIILGSTFTGIGLFAAGMASGVGSVMDMVAPLIFGGLGVVLHSLSFGLDPLTNKGMTGMDGFQNQRVAKAVDHAEQLLSQMSEAILRSRDLQLQDRVAAFQKTARHMFETVEQDPRDLRSARKYLGVYLQGARDATVKFADLYAHNQDPKARQDYLALLDDLQQNFATRTEKLLLDDRSDLDVEIEVLRERLKRD
ncbi:MAG: hypothetical protein CSA68_07085 [Rhodobacterales bacterium]|nr:MAG: hypothetical protein CSA68_07085 [Rhodobacterales bacterium]